MPPILGTVMDLKCNLKPATTFPLETTTGSDNHLATSPLETQTLGKDHLAYLPLETPTGSDNHLATLQLKTPTLGKDLLAYLPLETPTGSDDHLNTFPMETPLEVTIVSDCPLYIHRRPGATRCVRIMKSKRATGTKI